MARTLDPKRHTNSALTTELCRNIISKGCFDGYDKTEGKHFEKKYLLNPEKWTLPKVNTQRSQMIYTIHVAKTKALVSFAVSAKNREADLRFCFRIYKRWFSHDAAHYYYFVNTLTYE